VMTGKETALSRNISTGLTLRTRGKYTAMPRQGARRLSSAARAIKTVDRGGGFAAGSCAASRFRISAERSAPQLGHVFVVRISFPGIAPSHIGQSTGSVSIPDCEQSVCQGSARENGSNGGFSVFDSYRAGGGMYYIAAPLTPTPLRLN
jgi:hypothetical protein